MKIFISHKADDRHSAEKIAKFLGARNGVECYVDVLDLELAKVAEDLAAYFKKKIHSCTHLIAVVSDITKTSWWVPFEIGIAAGWDFPLATYAVEYCELPGYLKKWPYLKSDADLDKYVQIAQSTQYYEKLDESKVIYGKLYTESFYKSLRHALGQGGRS